MFGGYFFVERGVEKQTFDDRKKGLIFLRFYANI